jgi:hypothetical protein
LAVSEPGEEKYYIFHMEKYSPPPDKYKDGSLDPALDHNSGKKSKKDPE